LVKDQWEAVFTRGPVRTKRNFENVKVNQGQEERKTAPGAPEWPITQSGYRKPMGKDKDESVSGKDKGGGSVKLPPIPSKPMHKEKKRRNRLLMSDIWGARKAKQTTHMRDRPTGKKKRGTKDTELVKKAGN